MFISLRYMILVLWFGKKSFLSTIFLAIKVRPSNETDLDSCNKFHFFMIGHCIHVFLIKIHDINASVWKERLFFPPFSLESKFIYQLRQMTILVIISILFLNRHYNHVLVIRIHDIGALISQESFFLLFFAKNQS